MSRLHRVFLSLIAVAMIHAGEAPPSLAAAQELLLQHRPKDAIPLFVQIVERNRYDLEQSEPALVGLVAAYQLLKGDAQAEQDYTKVAAKFLRKPPVLNGVATLHPELAREELLWKPWSDAPNPHGFVVSGSQRTREIENGKRENSLSISLEARSSAKLPLCDNAFSTAGEVTAVAVDGTIYSGTVSTSSRTAPWSVHLQFKDIPKEVTLLKSVSGKTVLTAVKRVQRQEIPLRKEATWTMGTTTGTVTSIHEGPREYIVNLSITEKGAAADAIGATATASASASAFASVSASADEAISGGSGSCWLKGVSGKALPQRGSSSTGGMGHHTMTYRFTKTEVAEVLVWESIESTSIREVEFTLTDVKVP